MPTRASGDASAAGVVVWLTGLPSSGKSAFAERVRARLEAAGRACCTLDGDAVRAALTPTPGYDDASRDAFYATLAGLAALLARQGLIVLVPATAHRAAYRARARALAPRLLEVWVATSAATCAARDAKGLYAAARTGTIAGLPGLGAVYEPPEHPEVIVREGHADEAVEALLAAIGV